MKNNYIHFLLFGIMVLTINMWPSQNILLNNDFSVTTEINSLDIATSATTKHVDPVILEAGVEERVVIAGTFQSALNCAGDWDPNCDYTALTFNSSTGLYTGTFQIPEGSHRYKVTVGGSWDINYGENGIMYGADIFLCVPSVSEEVTFTYDPAIHLVTTSPIMSGFSPDCLPVVVLAGSFQDQLGCDSDWMVDCSNTALTYNPGSGLFEGDFNVPPGCYYYRIYLESSWFNSFGKDGIFNGENYSLYIPLDSEVTHFTYDPVSHIVNSSPYGSPPQEVTQVFLVGSLQEAMGCNYNGEFDCEKSSLVFNSETGTWENSFVLPEGCYTYRVREIFGCEIETLYGQNGEPWGEEIQLFVPEDRQVHFRYDPETHIIESTPFSEVPQEVTKVSLIGSFQQEVGLVLNPESGDWEKIFMLPAGCYDYLVEETFGCNTISFYGENGTEGTSKDIQLYVPEDGEITFTYDPENHLMTSTPYSAPEISKVSITGTIQDVLCPDYYGCDKTALTYNSETGLWVGDFTLPKGCYTYQVQQVTACNTLSYGENGEMGSSIQLYVPLEEKVSFSYDPQTHIISSSPYSGTPQEVTAVSLAGWSLQNELILNSDVGFWEGSITLPAGCYTYWVKETFGCEETYYGENGEYFPEIQLYVPTEAEIFFSYDPQTHRISSTPYSGNPQEANAVSLVGSLQNELGCDYDDDPNCDKPGLVFNTASHLWEGSFTLPAGCYSYWVKEVVGCNVTYYGENDHIIQLYIPVEGEVKFSYDAQTHTMTSTPHSGVPDEVTSVSLLGSLQNELGCVDDYDSECDAPALVFNPDSGTWEGTFYLPAKCYTFLVKETFTCSVAYYGENGENWSPIQLFIPTAGEITFSYDPQTHIVTSTPFYEIPEEVIAVSLVGSLQTELGCDSDEDTECDRPALMLNPESGYWEGSFTLPAGCYTYRVKETFGCEENYYGKNGEYWTPIELFVPEDGEITFSYDPQTHSISSTPYSGVPQEVTAVSLVGSIQNGFGCDSVSDEQCDKPTLTFNPGSGFWEGNFILPEGCYDYKVEEKFGCNEGILFGENGQESGYAIQLYVPSGGEVTFSYNPQTHIISSTPYGDVPPEMTKVFLIGTLVDELGCANPWEEDCENSALEFNPALGIWEGSFTLPAGCYYYLVKETSICKAAYYGENGNEWAVIQLYVPADGEITFSYDHQTHIIISTPYSGVPEEVTNVNLVGSLEGQSGSIPLTKNEISGNWEGTYMAPAGCYAYLIEEIFGCTSGSYYGENGTLWGEEIQLYIPSTGEITFSYDPQTHIIISTPYSGAPQEVTKVSLYGSFQDEFGCATDFDSECDNPALLFNATSGAWEGSFTLPAGCYTYRVKETFSCNIETFYGENGSPGDEIQLYVPVEAEITFSYDPQTHTISSTPYSGVPQEVTMVSLLGSLQDELGCESEANPDCDKPELVFNPDSGFWEGSFTLPAGCYWYWIKETFSCNIETYYGENGQELGLGGVIHLYLPSDAEITFSYDPLTHIIISTPYFDISTANQCPENINVNNTPGICGAIVNYPEFVETVNCGGEISSITQTEGLPSGSIFPVGMTTNTFLLTKLTGEEITCSFDVVVIDTEVPVISDLNQTYEPLWPPNHKMVPVFIEYFTSDNCNIASTELIISSNEPETGQGNGDLAPDWEVLDEHNVLLRAERSAKGNGREYYITIKVTDSSGNFTERLVTVKVPRDNGKKSEDFSESEPGNNKYILYPNAADDIINIKGPKPITNSAYVIYDMLGVMRKQGKINNDPIEVISLPSGVYILKFEVDREYIFKKFIKN